MNGTRYLPFAGRLLIGLPLLVSDLSKLGAYGVTIALYHVLQASTASAARLPQDPLQSSSAVASS